MKLILSLLALAFIISACSLENEPCPSVPSDLEILEKYNNAEWNCENPGQYCYKSMRKFKK